MLGVTREDLSRLYFVTDATVECHSTMIRALATITILFQAIAALPAVQEPVLVYNTTNDGINETITTLTPSTIALTVKSRPVKEMSEVEERFKALGCDMPMMPVDTKLWRSNQTHELLLPTKVSLAIKIFPKDEVNRNI